LLAFVAILANSLAGTAGDGITGQLFEHPASKPTRGRTNQRDNALTSGYVELADCLPRFGRLPAQTQQRTFIIEQPFGYT
jgi:uncharacterized lipoprotein YmbA